LANKEGIASENAKLSIPDANCKMQTANGKMQNEGLINGAYMLKGAIGEPIEVRKVMVSR
jgi:hypothetical protein